MLISTVVGRGFQQRSGADFNSGRMQLSTYAFLICLVLLEMFVLLDFLLSLNSWFEGVLLDLTSS